MLKSKLVKFRLFLLSLSLVILIGFVLVISKINPNISSTVKASGSLTYSALGDSISNPYTVSGMSNYVPVFSNYAATDLSSSVTNNYDSYPGWTSSDLLNAVKTNQDWRIGISQSNIITLYIGFNDLFAARKSYKENTCGGVDNQNCLRTASANFRINYDQILIEIKNLNNNPNLVLRTVTIYNPFVSQDKADGSFTIYKSYLEQVNGYIKNDAQAQGFLIGDIYSAYNGLTGDEDPVSKNLIYTDGNHPNDTGMAVIANVLRALGYSALSPQDTDNDGCPDAKELGSDWKKGGQRDPHNRWDFYDVPTPAITSFNWNLPAGDPARPKMDHAINANDAQAVFAYFKNGAHQGQTTSVNGISYDTHYGYLMGLTNDPNFTDGMFYDRVASADPTQFWKTGSPTSAVTPQAAQLAFSIFSRGGTNCN